MSLGEFSFVAGGDQWVALFDNQADAPGSNQHIVADAVKLERVGDWCGDGACTDGERCVCGDCPVAEEVEANGIDDDCDGSVDEVSEAPADSGRTDSDTEADEAGKASVVREAGGCACGTGSPNPAGALTSVAVLVVALARRRWGLGILSPALLLGCVGGTVERNAGPGAAYILAPPPCRLTGTA